VSRDTSGIAAAVEVARGADVAILVVGDRAGHFQTGTVGEGTDVADLALPGVQPELVRAVLDTGTPTVVVLINGRPPALGEIAERAAAILEAWFPGQAGAEAIVDVLLGQTNPGGRTPLTFSAGAGAQPLYYNSRFLSRGMPPLPHVKPVFPFGHGLSYTTFAYSALSIDAPQVAPDGEVKIGCTIQNTGSSAGDEVVQLYITDPVRSVVPPVIELKGFCRLTLLPGARRRVVFTLPIDVLAFHGVDCDAWSSPGKFL